ncbi:MAG: hypothetical protein CVV02_17855 [Firmicutes bacterium HGW-Firmicutes-7]|nr:MAG: hypothetical protein CVV02_17855 [Firmicutes bacterium HGW-Firmicutes-7]
MLSGVFEIIGPKMIGPSSSHTAGTAKIGRVARGIFNEEPGEVNIYFAGTLGQKMNPLEVILLLWEEFWVMISMIQNKINPYKLQKKRNKSKY